MEPLGEENRREVGKVLVQISSVFRQYDRVVLPPFNRVY